MTCFRFTTPILIFLAVLCGQIQAQLSLVEQPMFQLTSVEAFNGTLQSIPGIHTYWVWTNGIIVNQLSRVTNWTALISPIGNAYKQVGSAANDNPLNATNGVFFNGFADGSFMTSSIVNFPSNNSYSMVMIQKMRRPDAGTPSGSTLFYGKNAGDGAVYSRVADTNVLIDIRPAGGFTDPFSAGYIGTNRSDLVVVLSNNPSLGVGYGGIYTYIDGVLRTNKVNASYTNFRSLWGLIGANSVSGGGYYDGWIYDIVFYTNVITSENISNIHYYNTNVYGPTGSGT